jgi:hypothetical protein
LTQIALEGDWQNAIARHPKINSARLGIGNLPVD